MQDNAHLSRRTRHAILVLGDLLSAQADVFDPRQSAVWIAELEEEIN